MNPTEQNFKAAQVGAKFTSTCIKFDQLLAQSNNIELTIIRKKLRESLKNYRQDGILTVAFIGQYSAGKSTVISALTGRRDIRIDSDMTTDQTTCYDWNGMKLIDTPGLFTERHDHDEMTYEAIAKADLLVFCLTSMLFDAVTVENFKHLAYTKGYAWKIMLIVNKMSDEAGDDEQKIIHYRQSLADALYPYSLDSLPLCFIDAKDYCQGMDEAEHFLLEVSRFPTFIQALNQFIARRNYLVKFDTPVRICLSYVEEAQLVLSRNADPDSAFLEILNRLSRALRKGRDRLRTKIKLITLRMTLAVVKQGTSLAGTVGNNLDIQSLTKQAEFNLKTFYEQTQVDIQSAVEMAIQLIQKKVADVIASELVQTFLMSLNQADQNTNIPETSLDLDRLRRQGDWIKSIHQLVTGELLDTQVSDAGNWFQPWLALESAKTMENMTSFLQSVLGNHHIKRDSPDMGFEQQLADIRYYINSQFQGISQDLESQINAQMSHIEQLIYGKMEQKINTARQGEGQAIARSHQWVKQLLEIHHDFEEILNYITYVGERARSH